MLIYTFQVESRRFHYALLPSVLYLDIQSGFRKLMDGPMNVVVMSKLCNQEKIQGRGARHVDAGGSGSSTAPNCLMHHGQENSVQCRDSMEPKLYAKDVPKI